MKQSVIYANIIDATGRDVIENGMVVIEEKRLVYVGEAEKNYPLAEDAAVYDYKNDYVMPGLIEAHSHLAGYGSGNTLDWVVRPVVEKVCQAVHDLEALLNAGFTSVRDMAGLGCRLRTAMNQGLIRGPRIMSANAAISQTCGHSDVWSDFPAEMVQEWEPSHAIADGAEQCRWQARNQFRQGADFIKIMTTGGIMDTASDPGLSHYTYEEIAVIVEEAKRMGTYVAAHAESNAGVYHAVKAGVTSIEHGYMTTDETIELMLEKDCIQIPTLSAMTSLMANVDTMQPHVQAKIRQVVPRAYESVARAHEAGVKMAVGADYLSSPTTGLYGKNGNELYELVKVGFTPMEAIMSCTRNGALLMKMSDEIGTLEAGKLADLIVVNQNPLKNIQCLSDAESVIFVMKEGNVEKEK